MQTSSRPSSPRASGAIGMQNAYDAPRDGYTWTGNADVSVVNYPVLDLMKVTHRDWNQWYALMTPNIIAVTADAFTADRQRVLDRQGTLALDRRAFLAMAALALAKAERMKKELDALVLPVLAAVEQRARFEQRVSHRVRSPAAGSPGRGARTAPPARG